MLFKKFIPKKSLNGFIDAIFYIDVKADEFKLNENIFIPNGHPTLVIHLASSVRVRLNGSFMLLPDIFFTGLINTHVPLQINGDLNSIFVLFKPSALYTLFRVNMRDLNSIQFTHFENIICENSSELHTQLLVAHTIIGRVQLIECYLEKHINRCKCSSDIISIIIDSIIKERGCARVSDMSKYFNIPERSLCRNFATQTGLSPKEFTRMVRFRCIMENLRTMPMDCWADIIANADLTDQSHLIKEIKRFTGHSPNKILSFNLDCLRILNGTA